MQPVLSTAFTNLGNALVRAHRWVEAYDAYSSALKHDRTNSVASTGAARFSPVRTGASGTGAFCVSSRHVTRKLRSSILAASLNLPEHESSKKSFTHFCKWSSRTSKPPDLRDAAITRNLLRATGLRCRRPSKG